MKPLFFLLVFFIAVFTANAQNIRYVKPISTGNGDGSSWANASHDLQAMMDSLKATGGQVWVAQGTYKPLHKTADTKVNGSPTGDKYKSFVLVKDVEVYGGFQGISTETTLHHRNWDNYKTILSGDIGIVGDSTDNVFHVVISVSDVGNACLDGFTVTGGNAIDTTYNSTLGVYINGGYTIIPGMGGGILILFSSPLIKNVIFEKNKAMDGGGIYCNRGGKMQLTNVIIQDNSANKESGIYCGYTEELQLTNLIIRNNKTEETGGCIWINESHVIMVNTIIDYNVSTYACINIHQCSLIVINTIICNNINLNLNDNANNIPLIFNYGSYMEITNTLINNNEIIPCPSVPNNLPGAILNYYASLVITNSTIANNYNSCDSFSNLIINRGGTIDPSYLYIRNSIFWDKHGGKIINTQDGYTVYENNISGGILNGIPYGTNPFFVNASAQNYQLQPCSPAIDIGNNAYYSSDSLPDISGIVDDLEGNPRFYNNGTIDIGAYEYQGTPVLSPDVTEVTIRADTTICYGDTANITFILSNSLDWDIVYTTDNENSYDTIKNISGNSYLLKEAPIATTIYKLVSVSNKVCENFILSESITLTVIPELSLTNAITSDILCHGEQTKTIDFTGMATDFIWEATGNISAIPTGKQTGIFGQYTVENNTTEPLTSTVKVFPYYNKDNIYCQGKDTHFTVTVLPEAKLQTMLFNDTLCPGEQTQIIDFRGTATHYQWENRGYPVTGIPPGIQTGNFGNYTVENKANQTQEASITVIPQYQLDNKLCLGEESKFNLLVFPQTQIHDVSKNKFIYCEEEMLEIQTEATGADLNYQWYHNNNLLAGATNEFYIIPAVSRQDMGNYYIEVAGKCGIEKSSDINVAVSSDKMLVEKWNDVILVDNSYYEYYGYQWYRDNIPIAGAIEQFYQELGGLQGCYSVELTLANGQKERSCERCVENKTGKSLSVYPNPVRQGENIQIQTTEDIISVQLYSLEGKQIHSKTYSTGNTKLDIPQLSSGMYIVNVRTQDGKVYNSKLVITQ